QRSRQFRRGDRWRDRPRLPGRVQSAVLVHDLSVDVVRAQFHAPRARGGRARGRGGDNGQRHPRIVAEGDPPPLPSRQARRPGPRPLSPLRPAPALPFPPRLGRRRRGRGRCRQNDRLRLARAGDGGAGVITRRDLLLAATLPLIGTRGANAAPAPALRDIAASRGLTYGTYVRGEMLDKDRMYTDLVTREAALIVCSCAQWRNLAPTATTTDYSGLEKVYAWAR